ncbi:hypothetical protein BDW59DRAFT_176917 [Aspergillus cavernicola]|uniref:Sodium/hydrogen exchanger family-domain-containing protein n=1 Tax=Aspergillus cavernicola TaxID=176166 RepID=A0ABR4HBG8_9EURO
MAGGFLPYHEPGIVQILIIVSFFFILSLAEWASAKIIRASIISHIMVSIIYRKPLADILEMDCLSARLDLLKANLVLSMLGAATGVCFPIGLSYLLLYLGFGYDLAQTRVGSVLVSAAVIDDVVGLVMARFVNLENLSPLSSCPTFAAHMVPVKLKLMLIICLYSVIGNLSQLEGGGDVNLGWLIGRPIVASIVMAIVTPIMTNAFLAGTFLTYLPSKHPEGLFFAHKSPIFIHTFERYLMDVQKYLMEPLFFASIGFAIPFVQLWTGKRIWRGIIYTLLMVFAKFVVGVCIPLWGCWPIRKKSGKGDSRVDEETQAVQGNAKSRNRTTIWLSALLLGSAMVARGEIGLLIIEIGYNQTSYITEEGFITGVWAILLNTIIGPATVGVLVKFCGKHIGEGE